MLIYLFLTLLQIHATQNTPSPQKTNFFYKVKNKTQKVLIKNFSKLNPIQKIILCIVFMAIIIFTLYKTTIFTKISSTENSKKPAIDEKTPQKTSTTSPNNNQNEPNEEKTPPLQRQLFDHIEQNQEFLSSSQKTSFDQVTENKKNKSLNEETKQRNNIQNKEKKNKSLKQFKLDLENKKLERLKQQAVEKKKSNEKQINHLIKMENKAREQLILNVEENEREYIIKDRKYSLDSITPSPLKDKKAPRTPVTTSIAFSLEQENSSNTAEQTQLKTPSQSNQTSAFNTPTSQYLTKKLLGTLLFSPITKTNYQSEIPKAPFSTPNKENTIPDMDTLIQTSDENIREEKKGPFNNHQNVSTKESKTKDQETQDYTSTFANLSSSNTASRSRRASVTKQPSDDAEKT